MIPSFKDATAVLRQTLTGKEEHGHAHEAPTWLRVQLPRLREWRLLDVP
jgi:hypothetical protein